MATFLAHEFALAYSASTAKIVTQNKQAVCGTGYPWTPATYQMRIMNPDNRGAPVEQRLNRVSSFNVNLAGKERRDFSAINYCKN